MTDHTPISLPDRPDRLRDLCRHVDDGGAADYVRLTATDDPMDHDEHARPALAVPVADVEDLLDRVVPPLLDRSLAELIRSGQHRPGIAITDPARLRRRAMFQYADLATMERALSGDPTVFDSALFRTTTPERPTVGGSVIGAFLDDALRRCAGATDADTLRAAIAYRIVGGGVATRAEVVAGLAALHAAGRCTFFNFGGPQYLSSAHGSDPAEEPALSVLVAEYLAAAGPDGAGIQAIADHLTTTYDFGDGPAPVPGRVIIAAANLVARRLAVELDGTYFAPQHAPTEPGKEQT